MSCSILNTSSERRPSAPYPQNQHDEICVPTQTMGSFCSFSRLLIGIICCTINKDISFTLQQPILLHTVLSSSSWEVIFALFFCRWEIVLSVLLVEPLFPTPLSERLHYWRDVLFLPTKDVWACGEWTKLFSHHHMGAHKNQFSPPHSPSLPPLPSHHHILHIWTSVHIFSLQIIITQTTWLGNILFFSSTTTTTFINSLDHFDLHKHQTIPSLHDTIPTQS